MRDYFRRLPPFLRVVSAIGLLFLIAGGMLLLLLWLNPYWSPFHVPQSYVGRSTWIAINLALLGDSCLAVVDASNERLRQPGRRWRIPLDSWQSQAQAVALAVVAPLCGLIVNLVNPSNFDATNAYLVVMFVLAYWPFLVIALLAPGKPSARSRSWRSARQPTRKRKRQVR